MPFNIKSAWSALFRDQQAEAKPKAELGEVAYNDILHRMFGDPKKAFPVYNYNEVVAKKGIRYFAKMSRDDQIKAALALKTYAVMAGGWTVNSPEGKEADWEPTEFVRQNFAELGSTLEGAADGILSKFAYGFSLTEKVWGEQDNMIWLADLKTRHPYGINFEQDGHGNVQTIYQGFSIEGGLSLPPEKFLLCVHNGLFNNPYGQSDLESAYRPWWIKENSYKWMAILLEKMGIPPIFVTYDSNVIKGQTLTDLKDIIKNLQAATSAALPRGSTKDTIDFWAPELAGNVAQAFAPAIRLLNEDIARSILLPALLGLTPDTNIGSQARSTVHFDVFMMIIDRERKYLETMLNRRVVRDLVDYNFAGLGNDRPYLQLLPMTDERKTELFKIWAELVSKSVVSKQVEDEKHLRTSLEMPAMTEETVERREQQLEAGDDALGAGPGEGNDSNLGGKGAKKGDPKGKSPDADTYAQRSPEERARAVMEKLEASMLSDIRHSLSECRDTLIVAMRERREFNAKFAETVHLRKIGGVQDALEEGLRAAWQAGAGAVTFEAEAKTVRTYMAPRAAIAYIKGKSVEISGIVRDDLTKKAKNLILNAVKNGEPLEVTIQKAIEMFSPYLGAEAGVEDETLKPYRLETILRTNVTDAYNQGRLSSIQDPEVAPYLAAVRYSSILDTRTTQCCQFLHGKLFRLNDPELLRFTPPNHFNCRSLLVPITKAQARKNPLRADEFITPSDVGKAAELAGPGFYSLSKPVDGGSDLDHLRRYADEIGIDIDIPEGAEL